MSIMDIFYSEVVFLSEEDLKERRKVLVQVAIVMFCAWALGHWIASCKVGFDVNHDQLLGFNLFGIYPPWAYSEWRSNPELVQAIPHVIRAAKKWIWICLLFGAGISYQIVKAAEKHTSHGSAEWAKEPDIIKAGLGEFKEETKTVKKFGIIPWKETKRERKESGVVVGINPFKPYLMLHDGPEHMLLMAPTRSGKGINTIIPTGLIWKASIFFFDPKGELWQSTSGYRKNILHQKVLKFQPLRDDGAGVRWNPLAEVEFRHQDEISDIETIVGMLVKPDGGDKGGSKDPFWDNAAGSVLKGVIMHLMYARYADGQRNLLLWQKEYKQTKTKLENAEKKLEGDPEGEEAEKLKEQINDLKEELEAKKKKRPGPTPLPCLTEVMSFLSPADAEDLGDYFKKQAFYPHITAEEFLERKILDDDGNPVLDDKGNPTHYENPLKTVYGNYITNFAAINDKLNEKATQKGLKKKFRCSNIEEVRKAIYEVGGVDFGDTKSSPTYFGDTETDDLPENPFRALLTHPKVAEAFANIANNAEQTRASILGTATTALTLYQNPVVQRNTEVSDFCIRDLLNPAQEVSLYLVMEPKDIAILKPLSRLFINTMLDKLARDMKFELNSKAKKQRLLLMLDEFPQLGNMQKVELSLAICAGYGIKMCIVSQDVNQLNKEYTKDNSIGSNCNVHIYFTPNLDSGGATAEAISKMLGKKTITTVNHSDGGGGFFKGSDSFSQTGRELLTPDEVMKLPADEEIVFIAGNKPVRGKKLRYYEHAFFTDKISDNPMPMYSDTCTKVATYDDLFAIHAADWIDKEVNKAAIFEAKVNDGIAEKPTEKEEENFDEKEEALEIDTPVEAENPSEENGAGRRPLASQRTRGNRPGQVNRGGVFPHGERRDMGRPPRESPFRSSENQLISRIAKIANLPLPKAENLLFTAPRRDVQRLMMFMRDIPEDTLLRRIANIKDISEAEAMDFIKESKTEAKDLFLDNEIKDFIKRFGTSDDSSDNETPSASDIVMPNPEEVKKQEEEANEALNSMISDMKSKPVSSKDDAKVVTDEETPSEDEKPVPVESSDTENSEDSIPDELLMADEMKDNAVIEEEDSSEKEEPPANEEASKEETSQEEAKPHEDPPKEVQSEDKEKLMSNTAEELFQSIDRAKTEELVGNSIEEESSVG